MKVLLLACLVASSAGFNVFAVNHNGYTTDSGIVIKPLLNIGLTNDDNLFNQPTNEVSSNLFTIAPSVGLLVEDGINQYQLELALESGKYSNNSDDNYLDRNLTLSTHLEPSSRSRWDLSIDGGWMAEPRGTGITEGLSEQISEPLTYAQQTFKTAYEYGHLSSSGRIAFELQYYNKNYTNLDEITRFRNFDTVSLGSIFYYSTNSRTDVFFELTHAKIQYDQVDIISRDSNEANASLGIQWKTTALTTNSIKVGYQNKSFQDSLREDFSGISWDVAVMWQPLTYSTISLSSSRKAAEPNILEADYNVQTTNTLAWQHAWNERFSSSISTSIGKDDYNGIVRNDKIKTLTAKLDFTMYSWLDISVFIETIDKTSNLANIVYEKNVMGVNFSMSL